MNIQAGALTCFLINFYAREETPLKWGYSAANCELNKFRNKELGTKYTRIFDLRASNSSPKFFWKGKGD
jgi:hypothetical protein